MDASVFESVRGRAEASGPLCSLLSSQKRTERHKPPLLFRGQDQRYDFFCGNIMNWVSVMELNGASLFLARHLVDVAFSTGVNVGQLTPEGHVASEVTSYLLTCLYVAAITREAAPPSEYVLA